jgi:hypothetical protein
MVATESNRLPSFKNRPAQSPRENETKGTEEQSREEPLERSRGLSANSGLDIETKVFSATSRRRSFFVDIPFYRTSYLSVRLVVEADLSTGIQNVQPLFLLLHAIVVGKFFAVKAVRETLFDFR